MRVALLAAFRLPPAWLLLSACSALVDATETPVRCEDTAGCPAGEACIDGECRDSGGCDPAVEEVCNGRDDDCNDGVDEGHDGDGDGSTWCGGGDPDLRDCDDNDPNRAPGAAEVCDGADNDCDGPIDEGACAEGEACNAFAGVCEPFDCRIHGCPDGGGCNLATGVCDAPDCRTGEKECFGGKILDEVCDPFSGLCVSQLGPLGSPCTSHVECLSEFCIDANVVRLDALGGSVCSELCCTNTDCPPDFVCWESGSGTGACISRAVAGAPADGTAVGAACTEGNECASGICGEGTCAPPCCVDRDCGAGGVCAMTVARGRSTTDLVLACGGGAGSAFDEACIGAGDCASSLCLDGNCTRGCCTSRDCGPDHVCLYGSADAAEQTDYFRVCALAGGVFGGGVGTGAVGDDCLFNEDCRSNVCTARTCTDTCCSNADCPVDWSCRPQTFGEGFVTFCELD